MASLGARLSARYELGVASLTHIKKGVGIRYRLNTQQLYGTPRGMSNSQLKTN